MKDRQGGQKKTKRRNAGKTWDEREAANEIEEERSVNFKGVYFTWSIQTKHTNKMRNRNEEKLAISETWNCKIF